MKLAAACLTTTFVLTQRVGAVSRIAASENSWPREQLLQGLLYGKRFATVGISHLTTSRQHMARPVLQAEETADGFVLDGYSPWVTGAEFAQHVVLGANVVRRSATRREPAIDSERRQILLCLPTDLPGVQIERSPELVGLSASRTGPIHLHRVQVDRRWLLAGPTPEVMRQGQGAKTGGLQTSALAIGLATASIRFIEQERQYRDALADPSTALRSELDDLQADLLSLAAGATICTGDDIRTRANSLVLRAAQAALAAAKGAGYVASHPAGRWCREALFFLVWSCPQSVITANLCELAGISDQ
jgi:alkylation response protein AidB-like acyl-CoA dehydrogenase